MVSKKNFHFRFADRDGDEFFSKDKSILYIVEKSQETGESKKWIVFNAHPDNFLSNKTIEIFNELYIQNPEIDLSWLLDSILDSTAGFDFWMSEKLIESCVKPLIKYISSKDECDINKKHLQIFDYVSTPLQRLVAFSENNVSKFLIEECGVNQYVLSEEPYEPKDKDQNIPRNQNIPRKKDYKNALHLVLLKGRQGKICEYEANNAKYPNCDNRNQLPLFESILGHQDTRVRINDKTYVDGFTALHIAALRRDAYYINKLMENGADLTIKDNKNRTPYDLLLPSNDRLEIIQNLMPDVSWLDFGDDDCKRAPDNNGYIFTVNREIFDREPRDVLLEIPKGFSSESSLDYDGHGLTNRVKSFVTT